MSFLKGRIRSFKYALNGLKNVIIYEQNMRLHLIALFMVVLLGFYFSLSMYEWKTILLAAGIVITLEIVNTAIERLADIVEPKWNSKIGLIKDYSAAAVFVGALLALILGGLVFLPKIVRVLFH